MGIFERKRKSEELPSLFGPGEIESDQPVQYQQVMEYLVGLSDDDFDTIKKVAAIYRKSDKDASEVLGLSTEPTTFIDPPKNTEEVPHDVNHIQPDSFLADDDDLIASFLEDELPTRPTPKPTTDDVKNRGGNAENSDQQPKSGRKS